jgi:hypothetical protein
MTGEYPPSRHRAPAASGKWRRRIVLLAGTGACLALTAGGLAPRGTASDRADGDVALPRTIRDSMNAVFLASNEHWNELGDLNTLERMLGTVRATQREYLGCLQGTARDGVVRIDGWMPAHDMKRLQLAVTGSCEGVPRLVGTWHTHPYHADLQNLPIKERSLSPQDLETFRTSDYAVMLVIWDVDSLDAAVRAPDGTTHHPAAVRIE